MAEPIFAAKFFIPRCFALAQRDRDIIVNRKNPPIITILIGKN